MARARLRVATTASSARALFSGQRADGHHEWFRPQRVYPGTRRSGAWHGSWLRRRPVNGWFRFVLVSFSLREAGWVLERGPWIRLLSFLLPRSKPGLGRIIPQ